MRKLLIAPSASKSLQNSILPAPQSFALTRRHTSSERSSTSNHSPTQRGVQGQLQESVAVEPDCDQSAIAIGSLGYNDRFLDLAGME
jgi:hypothetical protein